MVKKCPVCNSTRLLITAKGIQCKKCGFSNLNNYLDKFIKKPVQNEK